MADVSRPTRFPPKPFKWLALLALFALGMWFLLGEVIYAATRDRTDESLARSTALIVHLVCATPLLLLAPLQFSRRIRARWPRWHRRAGQLYLVSAIIAALGAIYLGPTFENVGRRVPLLLFAVLWLAFSIAAWVCASRRAFAAHERFVVRSYAIALAFVFVRVMGETQGVLFAFMPDREMVGVTREWLSFVVPLVAIEAWYGWWPSLRATKPGAAG